MRYRTGKAFRKGLQQNVLFPTGHRGVASHLSRRAGPPLKFVPVLFFFFSRSMSPPFSISLPYALCF